MRCKPLYNGYPNLYNYNSIKKANVYLVEELNPDPDS